MDIEKIKQLHDIGAVFLNKKEIKKSESYINKTFKEINHISDFELVSGIYLNKGILERAKKNYNLSEKYIKKSILIIKNALN